MTCELMNACYSICAAFFQAGYQPRQSIGNGSDSLARVAHRNKRSARDGIESRKAFSKLSPGSESGDVELFERLKRLVKTIDKGIWIER